MTFKKWYTLVVAVLVFIIFTGCGGYISQEASRSLVADLEAARKANIQASQELNRIIELKDKDIETFAPYYADYKGLTKEDLMATLNDSARTTAKARQYLNDLQFAADRLEKQRIIIGGE